MSRVLLVCPEPLGHGQPAGVGIRFLEFARALVAAGHDVTMLSADGGSVTGCASDAISPQSIRESTGRADVAVVQGHIANELFAHGVPLPTVVDLYDPYLVENLHYWRERGDEVFLHDRATLLQSLRRGDFFLCASDAQRQFYLGMMITAGRIGPETFDEDPTLRSTIDLAPFGVPPQRTSAHDTSAPSILFGGIYDWYLPVLAIEAVRIAREELPSLTLTFTRHPNPDVTPQGAAKAAADYVARHRLSDFVRFEPWVPYDERGAFYDRFAASLLTFPQSIETDLSMRTRIYDFLWAGLPVVSSSAAGTDALLEKYGAGVVVLGEDARDYARALIRLVRDKELLERMRASTARFVGEHQWEKTLAPLLEFCAAPRRAAATATATPVPPGSRAGILHRLRLKLRSSR